jgi:8-oxo-dGTP pyrophosphatase MutT (NUDIX family)
MPARPAGDSLNGVAERTTIAVERRSARAIAIDDEGRLVLIKRSKPGQEPYWTTAGGGVEDSDASIEAAMHRLVVPTTLTEWTCEGSTWRTSTCGRPS